MAWASEQKALETQARHVTVVQIDLTDPDGVMPDSGQWTASRTLYVATEPLKRTSSGAGHLTEYVHGVIDIGEIAHGGEPSTAFQTLTQTQVTLSNMRWKFQEPASKISSGPTAMSPEPTGEDIRASELCRMYQWPGAAITISLLSLGSANPDQATATYQLTEQFVGEINKVSTSRDRMVLDCTVVDAYRRSELAGRFLDEDEDGDAAGTIPVVYGACTVPDAWAGSWAYEASRLKIGAKPFLTPALYRRLSSQRYYYGWNDCKGVNSGWTSQPDWGTTSGSPTDNLADDLVVRFHPEIDSFTIMDSENEGAGPTEGKFQFHDDTTGGGANEELEVSFYRAAIGTAYIRCDGVASSTGLSNGERACDANPTTYAELDVSSTSNIALFRIPETAPLGDILIEDDAIIPYILWEPTTVDTAVRVELSLWRTVGSPNEIGSGATTITGTQLATRTDYGGASMTIASFFRSNSNEEPPLRWQWQYSDGSGSLGDMRIGVKVAVQGSAGQVMRIAGVGLAVRHSVIPGALRRINRSVYEVINDYRYRWTRPGYEIAGRSDGGRKPVQNDEAPYYIVSPKSTIDDASGTVDSAEANLQHPVHVAHHQILKWVRDVTGSDVETTASTFGSFAAAEAQIDDWIQGNVAGGGSLTWDTRWTISSRTSPEAALTTLCNETPMTVYLDPSTGKFLCLVYEPASIQSWEKFNNSAGSQAEWVPRLMDARGVGTALLSAYGIEGFEADTARKDQRVTGVRINFRRFAPTGEFLESVYANPDEQKVWSETAGDYVTGSSGTLYTACNAAEDQIGRRTEDFVLDAVTVQDPATATGLLYYWVTRLTGAPMVVRGVTNAVGANLKVGHYTKIGDDMALEIPPPKYGAVDWTDHDFIVTKVARRNQGASVVTEFEGIEWLSL